MTTTQDGPDQIKPADNYWTIDPETPVKLRIGTEGVAAREPISVPGVLSNIAREYPSQPALRYKDETSKFWQTITYEYVPLENS